MPNTNPFRLEVLRRLTVLLETVVPGDPDITNMAGRVHRGRIIYGEETPVPFICIMEPPVPVEQIVSPHGSESTSGDWDLLIQGFVDDDKMNPTDPAHFLSAAVRKVLATHRALNARKDILGFGERDNVVEQITIGSPVVRNSDDISPTAYFWLPITLKVVESLDDPLAYKESPT
jgi:hypothetical protein